MNFKIRPRGQKEKGGYACMPLKGNIPQGKKTCKSCIDNDNGLCDRKGILIHEDDTCDKHREDWRQRMMEKFDRRDRSLAQGNS